MPRVGAMIPALTDGTSFYRGAGPLQALSKDEDYRIEIGGMVTWAYLRGLDGLFLQRPYTKDHLNIVHICKANGTPVWVDYDDDLFTVPIQNPTHRIYGNPEFQNNITRILCEADFVSVSTECLKEKFGKILEEIEKKNTNERFDKRFFDPDKIKVIPNAYDSELFRYSAKEWDRPAEAQSLSALWRGSHTHDADMSRFTVDLGKAIEAGCASNLKWTYNFVGSPWWGTLKWLEENLRLSDKELVITQPLDVIEYHRFLHVLKPSIVYVPLLNDPFNRAKSNVGWIEATHAGAVCLAPDWPEWRRPGIINYKSPDDFGKLLTQGLKGGWRISELVQESRNYINESLTLRKVNRKRVEIIEAMVRLRS